MSMQLADLRSGSLVRLRRGVHCGRLATVTRIVRRGSFPTVAVRVSPDDGRGAGASLTVWLSDCEPVALAIVAPEPTNAERIEALARDTDARRAADAPKMSAHFSAQGFAAFAASMAAVLDAAERAEAMQRAQGATECDDCGDLIAPGDYCGCDER